MARLPKHILLSGKATMMARMGAVAATEAAWITLGGSPSQILALRLYLARMARGER